MIYDHPEPPFCGISAVAAPIPRLAPVIIATRRISVTSVSGRATTVSASAVADSFSRRDLGTQNYCNNKSILRINDFLYNVEQLEPWVDRIKKISGETRDTYVVTRFPLLKR
jgi:uncharacterized protein YecE (DUF72 family)